MTKIRFRYSVYRIPILASFDAVFDVRIRRVQAKRLAKSRRALAIVRRHLRDLAIELLKEAES